MAFIKQWTMCVCITLVISVILSIFTPRGRLSSFYKVIISLFIFISFVYPISVNGISNKIIPQIDVSIDNSNETMCENMIENQIKSVLIEHKIVGASVSANARLIDDEVHILSVDVFVPSDYDKSQVEDIIFDALSINTRVMYIGE